MAVRHRPYRPDDLDGVVDVHLVAFEGFFLSSLGRQVLRQMYKSYAESGMVFCVAADSASELVVGFAVGPPSGSGYLGRALRADPWVWGRTLAVTFARSPRQLLGIGRRVVGRMARPAGGSSISRSSTRSTRPEAAGTQAAYLLSLGVDPRHEGSGVGTMLLGAWEGLARDVGATAIVLETDALDNARTLGFYQARGYVTEATFQSGSRSMKKLRKELS